MGVVRWIIVLALAAAGCERGVPAQNAGKPPRVVSVVPAATDLIIAMGAGDHLVGVSSYDVVREGTKGLPRVGDYQTFDWEQIAALKPDVMIVFMTPDRMPAGLKQRAQALKIRLVNVRTERVAEILEETRNLGKVVGEEQKAAKEAKRIEGQLEAARKRAQGKPKVKVLLVRDKSAQEVVGRENFLNDVLEAVGGENVVTTVGWPSIDREMLLSLKPELIIQLLPEASMTTMAEAERVWGTMPQIPAVANARVHILRQWWVQNSGSHVGELAQTLATILHGSDKGGPQ